MWTPRNLKDWTRPTPSPLMYRGAGAVLFRRKSRMSSLFLVMFSARLLDAHHSPGFLITVGRLVSPCYKPHHKFVIRKFDNDVLWVGGTAVGCVLRVREEERWEPSFTCCGRWTGKSFIQEQVGGGSPRLTNLEIRMSGIIVLKAELKSMKSILT